MNINGRNYSKKEALRYAGNINQIAGVKSCVYNEGKATGVKAFEVSCGSGLEFTVLEGKCLDIFSMRYKGTNLNYITKPGLVSQELFIPEEKESYRNINAGMLYTCGMSNVGTECNDNGENCTFHGRLRSTAAENVSHKAYWQEDEYFMEISGEMREAVVFGENLLLKRKIIANSSSNSIKLYDVIENQGFETRPLMLLYHINVGFPLLSSECEMYIPSKKIIPRDEEAKKGIGEYKNITKPIDGFLEQVFYHEFCNEDDMVCAMVANRTLNLGFYIKFNPKYLPYLIEWKSMRSGDYALGLEPSNCHVEGRNKEKEFGTLQKIKPFEKKVIELELGVVEGEKSIQQIIDIIATKTSE